MQNGKGSKRRPTKEDEYRNQYDRIFKKTVEESTVDPVPKQ